MMNSQLKMLGSADAGSEPAADRGAGARIAVTERPRATGTEDHDTRSAVLELIPGPGSAAEGGELPGTWLVSDALAQPQTVTAGGKVWTMSLRARRHYKPFSLTLKSVTHETYPGTEIPKNFASDVILHDESTGESREVMIYMNHPLRYGGETFYQHQMNKAEGLTVFQVVRNPSFAAPYVGCIVVGAGLLLQFGFHLVGFARRRTRSKAVA
jgi:hypothetical protein